MRQISTQNTLIIFMISALISVIIFTLLPLNLLVIPNQPVGSAIYVSSVRFGRPGFLSIQQKEGGRLGQSDYFPDSYYQGVSVELFVEEVRGEIEKGQILVAVMYHDNGDKLLDFGVDRPVLSKEFQVY